MDSLALMVRASERMVVPAQEGLEVQAARHGVADVGATAGRVRLLPPEQLGGQEVVGAAVVAATLLVVMLLGVLDVPEPTVKTAQMVLMVPQLLPLLLVSGSHLYSHPLDSLGVTEVGVAVVAVVISVPAALVPVIVEALVELQEEMEEGGEIPDKAAGEEEGLSAFTSTRMGEEVL